MVSRPPYNVWGSEARDFGVLFREFS
ncbi:protein of unknown function [Cupriavidus neocaledonicus]|uniref:Uncharacterized protein n=1 Tax=Cupriavidus neocaledonicus TaxID=1040979 RepID=A0A375H554_9BURK|nr:protein of unknown function [Cupriavidus neocaledonicus]